MSMRHGGHHVHCKPSSGTAELIATCGHASNEKRWQLGTGASLLKEAKRSLAAQCFDSAVSASSWERKVLRRPADGNLNPGSVSTSSRGGISRPELLLPMAGRLSCVRRQRVEVQGVRGLGVSQELSRSSWQLPAATRPGVLGVRSLELMFISNWKDLDIEEVRALLAATDQNCDQFPKLDAQGSILKVDPVKLKRAIQHSVVVVAMSMRGELEEDYYVDRPAKENERPWLGKRTLVAFGRATSDRALTASIHDIAVAPSLQRQGLGRRLVTRIVRDIVRYGISDISVMVGNQNRPFFQACGFGSDVLGSTAMMYTVAARSMSADRTTLLMAPALQESSLSKADNRRTEQLVNNVTPA